MRSNLFSIWCNFSRKFCCKMLQMQLGVKNKFKAVKWNAAECSSPSPHKFWCFFPKNEFFVWLHFRTFPEIPVHLLCKLIRNLPDRKNRRKNCLKNEIIKNRRSVFMRFFYPKVNFFHVESGKTLPNLISLLSLMPPGEVPHKLSEQRNLEDQRRPCR